MNNKTKLLIFLCSNEKLSAAQIVQRYAATASEAIENSQSEDEGDLTVETPSTPVGNSPVEASSSSKSKPIEAKTTRWRWNDEMIDSLILCLHDYKIKKDFEGKDMESDLIKMYEEIRQMMAVLYPPDHFYVLCRPLFS